MTCHMMCGCCDVLTRSLAGSPFSPVAGMVQQRIHVQYFLMTMYVYKL